MGCFIRRKVRFMAKSQLFKRPMQFIYTHGGVFPVRRGARDEETFITAETILASGRRDHDVLRGRSLAHRQSRRAGQARDRAARARDRRARRADRDLRLLARAQLEAPAVPARDRPVRRADPLGEDRASRRASSSRRSPTRSSSRSASSTPASKRTGARASCGGCARSAATAAEGPRPPRSDRAALTWSPSQDDHDAPSGSSRPSRASMP